MKKHKSKLKYEIKKRKIFKKNCKMKLFNLNKNKNKLFNIFSKIAFTKRTNKFQFSALYSNKVNIPKFESVSSFQKIQKISFHSSSCKNIKKFILIILFLFLN